MKGVRTTLTLLASAVVALLAWSWLGDTADDDAAAREPDGVSATVTVLAAASLTEAFDELRDRLAEVHPELDVVLSFGPSTGLVEQVRAGVPADILATADTVTMDTAAREGALNGEPTVIARNTPVLVTPADNAAGVSGLADLGREDLRIALCEPQVPCGAITQRLLSTAEVSAAPDTLTTDVKDALALVVLGEADAAVVYATDALAAGDSVETVPLPENTEIATEYPVATLAQAPNPDGARIVLDAITGELGQAVLADAGFLEP